MAKRPHPKTIEDKIHQILCMDQDPQPEHEVDCSKKCYLNLKSANTHPCATLATINYPLKTQYSKVNKSCDDGFERNNNNCRLTVQAVFHPQKVKTQFCNRSSNM